MSTAGCEIKSLPTIFKGRPERTGHCKSCSALPAMLAVPPGKPIPRQWAVKKKRELFPGLEQTSRGSLALPQSYPHSGWGILTPFPFDRGATKVRNFDTEFPYLSGPTNPRPTAVHVEPFSTPAFKVLI